MIILLGEKLYVVNAFEYNRLMAEIYALPVGDINIHTKIHRLAEWVLTHPILEGVQFDDLDGRI